MDLFEILGEIRELTKHAGAILKDSFYSSFEIYKKEEIEVVTSIDYRVERFLIEKIKSLTPEFEVMSEESFSEKDWKNLEYYWLIDPLDGTTNFIHRIPWFAISIALMQKKEPVLGVVYNPMTEEYFYAVKGKGAYFNDKPIRVSDKKNLEEALLCTSFPGECKKRDFEKCFKLFKEFNLLTQGVRRFGSASLDLAYVACGRYEGFWEPYLKPWDTAGGMLLVKEAGGMVTDYSGKPYNPFLNTIVASNGLIHSELIKITSKYSSDFL